MFSQAAPPVFVLAQRFGRSALVAEARAQDAGLEVTVLAQMMQTLNRFIDEEIPLPPAQVRQARAYFESWVADLTVDF